MPHKETVQRQVAVTLYDNLSEDKRKKMLSDCMVYSMQTVTETELYINESCSGVDVKKWENKMRNMAHKLTEQTLQSLKGRMTQQKFVNIMLAKSRHITQQRKLREELAKACNRSYRQRIVDWFYRPDSQEAKKKSKQFQLKADKIVMGTMGMFLRVIDAIWAGVFNIPNMALLTSATALGVSMASMGGMFAMVGAAVSTLFVHIVGIGNIADVISWAADYLPYGQYLVMPVQFAAMLVKIGKAVCPRASVTNVIAPMLAAIAGYHAYVIEKRTLMQSVIAFCRVFILFVLVSYACSWGLAILGETGNLFGDPIEGDVHGPGMPFGKLITIPPEWTAKLPDFMGIELISDTLSYASDKLSVANATMVMKTAQVTDFMLGVFGDVGKMMERLDRERELGQCLRDMANDTQLVLYVQPKSDYGYHTKLIAKILYSFKRVGAYLAGGVKAGAQALIVEAPQ